MLIKSPQEIESLREGGMKLATVLDRVIASVQPGMSTQDLDDLAESLIRKEGGIPSFKGYKEGGMPPFPGSLCTSINNEVVHGIPRDDRLINEGDLLKLDIGMWYDGLATDMARTVAVGEVTKEARKLMEATRKSLDLGLKKVKPGNHLFDYSKAVQEYAEGKGYGVVRELIGHGVGHAVHEEPQIPNYVDSRVPDFEFQAGMVLAFEPMVNVGRWKVHLADDGWTFVTEDGSLSAHFEDTVVVTEKGSEVITRL